MQVISGGGVREEEEREEKGSSEKVESFERSPLAQCGAMLRLSAVSRTNVDVDALLFLRRGSLSSDPHFLHLLLENKHPVRVRPSKHPATAHSCKNSPSRHRGASIAKQSRVRCINTCQSIVWEHVITTRKHASDFYMG